MLVYAMLCLAAIGITRTFPSSIRIPGHQDAILAEEVNKKIKDCLKSRFKYNQDQEDCLCESNEPGWPQREAFGELACK